MPIRPENRDKYPPDWKAIRERIRDRAGDRCEWCGVANHSIGFRYKGGLFHHAPGLQPGKRTLSVRGESAEVNIFRIVCTVAHVHDPDPANCDDENLAFLCQRCHLTHDAKLHAERAAATRLAKKLTRQPRLFE